MRLLATLRTLMLDAVLRHDEVPVPPMDGLHPLCPAAEHVVDQLAELVVRLHQRRAMTHQELRKQQICWVVNRLRKSESVRDT